MAKPLGTSEKKRATADNLLQKVKKIGKSQPTKQHICKPHKPTHDQSLQKSCFFADTQKPVDKLVKKSY